jgi:hypothetical protein
MKQIIDNLRENQVKLKNAKQGIKYIYRAAAAHSLALSMCTHIL